MRGTIVCIALALAACGSVNSQSGDDVDADPGSCGTCHEHASCQVDACVCDDGYQGDGLTCDDVDECATDNGGCDDNATCTNTEGGRTCACDDGFEGDGLDCVPTDPTERRGCTVMEAEHPGYTNIAGDVVLCGNRYTAETIATACYTGWHVCRESEWLDRYPTNRTYPASPGDPDLIGPTLGTLTSWGAAQSTRCGGGVWQARQPEAADTFGESVCHLAFDTPEQTGGADYNPWNNGKFLVADDGTTIRQGLSANGTANWGSWDVSFTATDEIDGFAVYCCRN